MKEIQSSAQRPLKTTQIQKSNDSYDDLVKIYYTIFNIIFERTKTRRRVVYYIYELLKIIIHVIFVICCSLKINRKVYFWRYTHLSLIIKLFELKNKLTKNSVFQDKEKYILDGLFELGLVISGNSYDNIYFLLSVMNECEISYLVMNYYLTPASFPYSYFTGIFFRAKFHVNQFLYKYLCKSKFIYAYFVFLIKIKPYF